MEKQYGGQLIAKKDRIFAAIYGMMNLSLRKNYIWNRNQMARKSDNIDSREQYVKSTKLTL
ncbi:MAG: hypothetical protein OSJ73_09335 [Lachnospiraceae bacterium]|nr:hypothetical protein [Lachnospiraceae bacterium]